MHQPLVRRAVLVLSIAVIAAGCGGSDESGPEPGDAADAAIEGDAPDDATADTETGSGDTTEVGFGELIEGTFLLSGAVDERYAVGDDVHAFRAQGGCQDGGFGFGVNVEDAARTTTFATFGAQGQLDLSGGATGEFDGVELEVTVFPGGDLALGQRYSGPVRMVISEHDTGGVDADLNARRMTVTLLGSITGDDGTLDVDVTYRWVMGCP